MPTTDADTMECPLRNPKVHITTHNASGKAIVRSSNNPPATTFPSHKVTLMVAYTTSSMPVDLNNEVDMKCHQEAMSSGLGLVKPNGTVCRFVDFAPGNIGMMHRTQSLDYGVVIEGNVIMELDDDSVTQMTVGDVAVQRATMHAWRNASQTEWARMLFVLQDCKPLLVDGQSFKEDLGNGTSIFPSSGNDV